jgi:hypothetical protein
MQRLSITAATTGCAAINLIESPLGVHIAQQTPIEFHIPLRQNNGKLQTQLGKKRLQQSGMQFEMAGLKSSLALFAEKTHRRITLTTAHRWLFLGCAQLTMRKRTKSTANT